MKYENLLAVNLLCCTYRLRVEVNTPTVFASPYDAPKFGRMLDGYST